MIRYDFGQAPETELSEVRKAFEHISALVPVKESVSVTYPVDLPKIYNKDGKLISFVDGQTNTKTHAIAISPMVFSDEAKITNNSTMPMLAKVPPVQFVAAHEWAHVVSAINQAVYIKILEHNLPTLYMYSMVDMSDYGMTQGWEGLAEAFAEWHLSEGKTSNLSATMFAKVLGWRTVF